MGRSPMFLERRSYRLRRMKDAIRFLPVLGGALWMVPLLWPAANGAAQGDAEAMPMSMALKYIFGIWFFLVLTAWALWWRTKQEPLGRGADVPPKPGSG